MKDQDYDDSEEVWSIEDTLREDSKSPENYEEMKAEREMANSLTNGVYPLIQLVQQTVFHFYAPFVMQNPISQNSLSYSAGLLLRNHEELEVPDECINAWKNLGICIEYLQPSKINTEEIKKYLCKYEPDEDYSIQFQEVEEKDFMASFMSQLNNLNHAWLYNPEKGLSRLSQGLLELGKSMASQTLKSIVINAQTIEMLMPTLLPVVEDVISEGFITNNQSVYNLGNAAKSLLNMFDYRVEGNLISLLRQSFP